jgi:hypothetical protein
LNQRNGTNPSTTTKANTTNDGGSKTFLYNLLKKNMVAYINRYVTDYVSDFVHHDLNTTRLGGV